AFNRPTEIGSGIGVAIALFLPFMVFIKSTQLYEYNKNYNFMLLINLVYVISYTLSLKIYIFARFTDALSFVQILLIPVILKISSPKGIYYNLMMAVILLHILLFEANLNANTISAGNISNSGLGIMPYKSILNTKIVGIYD
ncbi:O118/O151 family O-antigen polymerase, partial [Escherichia coli]|nr:O118/O151 family O-antigen polymerase [Escherichia coli]